MASQLVQVSHITQTDYISNSSSENSSTES